MLHRNIELDRIFPSLYSVGMKKFLNPTTAIVIALALALIGFSVQVHAASGKATASATIVQPATISITAANSNAVISQMDSIPGTGNTVQVTIEFN